jgi:hypothetical protein
MKIGIYLPQPVFLKLENIKIKIDDYPKQGRLKGDKRVYTSVGQNFENFETFRKIPTEINFRKMVTKCFFRILFFRNQSFRKKTFRNQNFSKIYSKISKNP